MRKITIVDDPKSPIAEAYRTLRTNIQFSSVDKPLKSIVITSSGAGEGKSTTATNMAVAFAQSGKKVLIIDADLRKARLHEHFEVSNLEGLTNAIVDKKPLDGYFRKTSVENLSLITAGITPPNPSELLGSNGMKKIIDHCTSVFDLVIIDSPPVGFVTDGALLASYADGTVLVACAGEANIKSVQHAKELLDNVKANILGVVLNKIPVSKNGYYKYHYHSYTQSYFDQPKKKGLFKRKAK